MHVFVKKIWVNLIYVRKQMTEITILPKHYQYIAFT